MSSRPPPAPLQPRSIADCRPNKRHGHLDFGERPVCCGQSERKFATADSAHARTLDEERNCYLQSRSACCFAIGLFRPKEDLHLHPDLLLPTGHRYQLRTTWYKNCSRLPKLCAPETRLCCRQDRD